MTLSMDIPKRALIQGDSKKVNNSGKVFKRVVYLSTRAKAMTNPGIIKIFARNLFVSLKLLYLRKLFRIASIWGVEILKKWSLVRVKIEVLSSSNMGYSPSITPNSDLSFLWYPVTVLFFVSKDKAMF